MGCPFWEETISLEFQNEKIKSSLKSPAVSENHDRSNYVESNLQKTLFQKLIFLFWVGVFFWEMFSSMFGLILNFLARGFYGISSNFKLCNWPFCERFKFKHLGCFFLKLPHVQIINFFVSQKKYLARCYCGIICNFWPKFSAKNPQLEFQNLKKLYVKIPKFVFFFQTWVEWGQSKCQKIKNKNLSWN